MLDEINRTLVVVAIVGVVGAFAAGAWLTNLGGGVGGPASGSSVDPADWGGAANAICSDTNAEVVDFDQSLGPDSDPAASIARGAEILARRADGLDALQQPSARGDDVGRLIAAMRETQTVMLRVRDALERDDLEQANRLTLALQDDELIRLSHSLGAPWCELFGADDATIRGTATVNLLEAQSLLELHREDAGTYGGAKLQLLHERYRTELVPGQVSVGAAEETSYCVQSTVGYLTLHVRGPGESQPTAGSC